MSIPLAQINRLNVGQMGREVDVSGCRGRTRAMENTPLVVDGMMYVTASNECFALDAASGRQIWSFRTPRTTGLLSEAGGGANRGVALGGNRVFMITDNAHLLALYRLTGRKLWDVTMADTRDGYSASAAPMVIGDLVLSGIAGGDEGARGFLDAYRASKRGSGRGGSGRFRCRVRRDGRHGGQRAGAWVRGDVDDGVVRYGAGAVVLGHGQSVAGLQRRRAQGRQSLYG